MRDVYSAAGAVERGAQPDDEGGAGAVAPHAAAGAMPSEPPNNVPAEYAADAWAEAPDAIETADAPGAAGPATASVSRRRALQVLGALPLAAGTLGAQPPVQQQPGPGHPRQPHQTPNQAATGPTPQPPNARPLHKFFTAREARTAGVLADDIIPRDERSGSATEAGVIPFIDFHMSVPETSADTRTAMRGGLRWMDTESRRRFGVPYDRAAEAQRHAILDDIAVAPAQAKAGMRAGAAFFAQFRSLVGAGFFSSAMGHRDLQYKGNVFNPTWTGCPQPALDKLGVSYAVMNTRVPPQGQGTGE